MPQFKLCWEIELDANSPLEAAKKAQNWMLDYENTALQFYVQEENKSEIFSVDLLEEDEDAVLPVKEYKPIIER